MSIFESLVRQPLLFLFWIFLWAVAWIIQAYAKPIIPKLKLVALFGIGICFLSGVVFAIPDFSMSYMQQHFLNAAHNLSFTSYDQNDARSGFYGPLAYGMFSWWSTDLPRSLSLAKGFIILIMLVNVGLVLHLTRNISLFLRAAAVFTLFASAYYFYIGPTQLIFLIVLVLYIINRPFFAFEPKQNYSERYLLLSLIISGFLIVSLSLIKLHLLAYSAIMFPTLLYPIAFSSTNFLGRAVIRNTLVFIASIVFFGLIYKNSLGISYFEYSKSTLIAAGHKIYYGYAAGLLVFTALLLTSLGMRMWQLGSITRRIWLVTIAYCAAALPLAYASSKHGSDMSHIVPLWLLLVTELFRQGQIEAHRKSYKLLLVTRFVRSFSATMFIFYPAIFIPLTLESYGSTYKWNYLYDTFDSKVVPEITYIREKYHCESFPQIGESSNLLSCASFGFGESLENIYKTMHLSPLLTNENNFNLIDISVLRDKIDSGIQINLGPLFSGKTVAYFILPKDEKPFAMPNDLYSGPDLKLLIPLKDKYLFEKNYNIVEKTNHYDVYQSIYYGFNN